nr:UDP-2,3-diacylglucosamine diphosphatase [Bacteroidota bacterium]
MNQEKKIYFISDFHFGIPDREASSVREHKFMRWLDMVKAEAKEIFLLGDLFDFWFEYKTVVPKGYVRLLGKLAEIVDAGIPIHFFRGNHDMWAFDYLEKEIGMKLYRNPIIREFWDKKVFISHGDGLGPGDHGYKFIKYVFERKINQSLFRWIHPDIGTRLGLFWSRRSRYANLIRESREKEADIEPDFQKARLAIFCKNWLPKNGHIDYFIFGHWHIPNIELIGDNSYYVHLGDWITHFTYGEFTRDGFVLKEFVE